ncbi:hypothetical protein ADL35_44075, partial [Streptomyces sp. NRRL WC-3753]
MMPRGSAPSGWTGGDRTTSPIVKPQQKREKSCIRSQLRLRSPRCGRSPASRREAGCDAHGQERRGTLGGDLFGQIFHCATWAEEQYEEKADRQVGRLAHGRTLTHLS